MKNAKRWLVVFMIVALVVTLTVGMTACNKTKVDNESTAFAMSIQNPDGVFNPFFSTSAYDSSIISLTQISMLNTDQKGNLIAGLDQPTVALAFNVKNLIVDDESGLGDGQIVTDQDNPTHTEYEILIKNGIKFSDGQPLTIKDVLFNLYVYLDPVFTGSATIYSTDIVGLKAYRTGSADADDNTTQMFENNFLNAAYDALKELTAWVTLYAGAGVRPEDINGLRNDWFADGDAYNGNNDKLPWNGNAEFTADRGGNVGQVKVTFESLRNKVNHIASLYHDELLSDWNGINMEDYQKKAEKGPDYDTKFTQPWQVFMVNDMDFDVLVKQNGESGAYSKTEDGDYILDTEKAQAEYDSIVSADIDNMPEGDKKQNAIRDAFIESQFKAVFGGSVKTNTDDKGIVSYEVTVPDMSYNLFSQVVNYWGTSSKVLDELIAESKTEYFSKNEGAEDRISNIKGIWVEKVDSFTGKQTQASGAKDVTISGEHYVLHIRINEVDPKALMNFSFTVAPMHYYSNSAEIKKFNDDWAAWEAAGANPKTFNDYVKHFGVKFGDSDFMNNTVNAKEKIGLPIGAGSYQPSNDQGESDVTKVDASGSRGFFNNNIIYYTRNNNFWTVGADGGSQDSSKLQNAKIRMVVYKVVAADQIIASLKRGDIHFGDPSATSDNVKELMDAGLQVVRTMTSGYGYIGINPRYVPDHQVRQAIMMAMDIQGKMIDDYYQGGFAEPIYRPMSKTSWAYPRTAEPMYQYDKTGNRIKELVEEAGWRLNGAGVYAKGNETLDIKFTIAGGSTDHPAYSCFLNAQALLNKYGFNVQVVTSAQALSDLSAGKLAVWAAAWSSAIDPDMYQVYHKDSQASSTSNWGYKQIKADTQKYSYEYDIIAGTGLGEDTNNMSLSDLIDAARETNSRSERTRLYAQCLDCVMALAVELPTYQRYDIAVYNSSIIDASSLPRHRAGRDVNDEDNSEIGPYYGLLSRIWEVSFAA